MKKLESYIEGKWLSHSGDELLMYDASTGEAIASAGSNGYDYAAILEYGRKKGSAALRKMSFHERGRMLKALALFLHERRKNYYPLSYATGATRTDSWVDIDGGIGNLFAYSSLRRQFPDTPFYVDGQAASLSKDGSFIGHHIMVPRRGVAVHINAFNFPVWGMLEKIAVNLLAGVAAVVKPAEQTAFLTEAVVRDIISSAILPTGALQLVLGKGEGILDHVQSQDVVTFTGSAHTGRKLKRTPQIINEAVPFTMEADSLNSIVLGADVGPNDPEFAIFIKEVQREMTSKCGQKCTAVRRVLVPQERMDEVQEALASRLSKVVIGDPRQEEVRMGPLINTTQRAEVLSQLEKLLAESKVAYQPDVDWQVLGGHKEKGAFMAPTLLRNDRPHECTASHEIEVFGPVATLMPYRDLDDAIALSQMGKGSLVSSIVTGDDALASTYVLEAASHHGRILVLNRHSAAASTGHGSPMPYLTHGGPGRAGGSEEMGGKRGVLHYLQRTAIQGSPDSITAITQVFQRNGSYREEQIHPFRKHFEELHVGDTLVTAKHTVTEADIVNFANVSGDHFYAHTDSTSLEGTIFEQRVAHGYYILSKAAGLFVDARKGPVLLNYGIEECRFTKPVYPGMTIGVKFTVREKIAQEKRSEEDVAKGIVKFLVDVIDQDGETVALATILTMVRKLNQS